MRKLLASICAATLAGAVGLTGVMPASAFTPVAPAVSAPEANVVPVQAEGWERHVWGPRARVRQDNVAPRLQRRGNYGYYNGHRGYRYQRPGYRYHNGFWFPAGAFIAGAIIGNAINNSQPVYRERRDYGSAHVNWCYNRYRSYREWDNTFQPYNGPRQQCYSPYS